MAPATASTRQTFFLPTATGQRLCVFHPARCQPALGRIVHVHAFAEEMNKSRRMVALQAERLAQAGYAVLLVDLLGCGDSSGDFGDASWQAWMDDVDTACDWLDANAATGPLWLWGLRAGCLLAVDALRRSQREAHLLCWQPPASGKTVLQQFLRLKIAGEMLDGAAKGGMESMKQQLAAGQPVEVAGYAVAPALARGLEAASMAPPAAAGPGRRLVWLEVSTREDAALSPVAAKTLEQWRQAGHAVQSAIANGPGFWQTTEIEDAPALLDATLAALSCDAALPTAVAA